MEYAPQRLHAQRAQLCLKYVPRVTTKIYKGKGLVNRVLLGRIVSLRPQLQWSALLAATAPSLLASLLSSYAPTARTATVRVLRTPPSA
jgi:ABC-type lipoprotein release transport system permease subunit